MNKNLIHIILFVTLSLSGIAQDSTNIKLYSWKLTESFYEKTAHHFDTLISEFHIYNPAYQHSYSNSYLGNIGLATKSNLFFKDHKESAFIWQRAYDAYHFFPSEVPHFYTERPFTNVTYSAGENEEQNLNVIHTQNVNEQFNFGVKIRSLGTDGFYLRQYVKHKLFQTWTSYTSRFYSMHASFSSNDNNLFHNGGIIDDSYITDSTARSSNIVVKLSDTQTEMNTRSINLTQRIYANRRYKVHINDTLTEKKYSPVLSLGHHYSFSRSYRKFYDEVTSFTNPVVDNTLEQDFYMNTYNFANTFDTAYYNESKHAVFLQFHDDSARRFKSGAHVMVGLNNRKHYFFNKDTIFDYSKDTLTHDQYFGFGIFNHVNKKWVWELNGISYFNGYRQGDLMVEGNFIRKFRTEKLSYIQLSARFNKEKNDYFLNTYYSNHFRWVNNFLPPETTKITLKYFNERFRFEAGINVGFMDNFIYFDTLSIPRQETNTFDIYGGYLEKDFKLWKIHFVNKIAYQIVGNDSVLRLPEVNYYGALYFDDVLFNWRWVPEEFNNVLRLQLGADVYYHSSYYGYAYMPAIEVFHLQNEKLIGDYPIFSVFANVKLENTRIFVKYEHINTGLIENNPFTVLHYPLSEASLKFGLSWSFYN